LQVHELAKAVDHLACHSVGLEYDTDTMAVTDPAQSLGCRFGFSTTLVPNDTRTEQA
jgi:hypothetical protein